MTGTDEPYRNRSIVASRDIPPCFVWDRDYSTFELRDIFGGEIPISRYSDLESIANHEGKYDSSRLGAVYRTIVTAGKKPGNAVDMGVGEN